MHELTEEALVAASVTTVWNDFTDAASLAGWYWPARFESKALVEPVQEGRWAIRSAIAGIAVQGRVLTVDPPRSLRLEWRWAGEEHRTDVEITLEPAADDATRVIVRHTGFQTADQRESHVEGWSSCLQRLIDKYPAPANR